MFCNIYFSCLIGLLCKHALRVFNINGVFDLPSQYILKRWTKRNVLDNLGKKKKTKKCSGQKERQEYKHVKEQDSSTAMSYTSLLLGVEDANQTSATRTLHFDDQF